MRRRTTVTTRHNALSMVSTVPEVTAMWGISEGAIRNAIDRGEITADQACSIWLIEIDSVVRSFGLPRPPSPDDLPPETYYRRLKIYERCRVEWRYTWGAQDQPKRKRKSA